MLINFDMEMHSLKDLTLRLFTTLLSEQRSSTAAPHAGIALQAYLRATPDDLERLIGWAAKRRTRVTVRLVKGAYSDTEAIIGPPAALAGAGVRQKTETDAAYEQVRRQNCSKATHGDRLRIRHSQCPGPSLACIAEAERLGLPRRRIEFQMLYGMAEPIKEALSAMGYRVRDYCPLGETLSGMAYLVRRLLENTSNEGFLRARFNEQESPQVLLRDPATLGGIMLVEPETGFRNEPHADFSNAALRGQMTNALQRCPAGSSGHFILS